MTWKKQAEEENVNVVFERGRCMLSIKVVLALIRFPLG